MKRSNGRLIAGLCAGVVLGALGPIFQAVAWHTGNDSGSEPVTIAANVTEDYVATAGWNLDFDSNIENGYDDHFVEIVAHRSLAGSAAPGAQSGSATWTGEVIAWHGFFCYAGECSPPTTWRGTIDPAAGNVFWIDPLTGAASFHGTLVEEGGDAICEFRVGWGAGAPDGISLDNGIDWTLDRLDAELEATAGRPAYPGVIDAPCWPTPLGGIWNHGAHGTLLASTRAVLAVVDGTHGCARVPVRGRVCWRER